MRRDGARRQREDRTLPPCQRIALFTIVLLVSAGGASCPRRTPAVTAPIAFHAPPTLTDLLHVVNANSDPIHQLQTDNARLSVQGVPGLRASVALQRPRSFRLRAQFIGLGEVLDTGSNDELFWALVDAPQMATGIARAVYYARHDQYLSSQARQILPIKPDLLVEAFGLTRFDPSHSHEGPWEHGPGQVQFRSRIPSAEGEVGRITVVHATYGWILEQHQYDPQGQWAASALTSNHRYYPEIGVSLPHRIEVRLPSPHPSFQLDIEAYSINQLRADPRQLFAMPDYPGYPLVNLADPAFSPPVASPYQPPAMPHPASPPSAGYPVTGYRPRYRGYTANWQ
jgi:hypothetical protein